MSYQALYRVWRPQRFSDLVGQQIVSTTLKNAIITKKISHAYLFAGPRGTGEDIGGENFCQGGKLPPPNGWGTLQRVRTLPSNHGGATK